MYRLWPQFLNKLLYASENSLRPFVWLGEIPYLARVEGRGTRLLYLDDESYASDEAKPLPE